MITVRIDVTTDGEDLIVKTSGYDPEFVDTIKRLHWSNRVWEPATKTWRVKKEQLSTLREMFPHANFVGDLTSAVHEKRTEENPLEPQIEINYHGYEPKTKPYGFQEIGASFLSQGSGALFDECFVTGTLISTPTGSVPIENVQIADLVFNATGIGTVQRTVKRISNEIVRLALSNGVSIACTSNHRFFTEVGWLQANQLLNHRLFTSSENRYSGPIWVESVSCYQPRCDKESPGNIDKNRSMDVYNLEVSGHPTYYANCVLVHNCGTGKTRQCCDAFGILRSQSKAKRMLVICPVSLMRNWAQECERHSNFTYVIAESTGPIDFKKKPWLTNVNLGNLKVKMLAFDLADLTNADILIINYDKVRAKKEPKSWKIIPNETTAKLQAMIRQDKIQVIVCDESHKIKNRTAAQTIGVTSLKAKYCWGLTATPLGNKPEEIQPLGDWVTNAFGGWSKFSEQYLVWGRQQVSRSRTIMAITGYKNQTQLKSKISEFSLRRRKDEVLDLPPKTFQNRYYEMTETQERAYDEMKQEFISWLKRRKNDRDEPLTARAVISQMIRLNQIASNLWVVGGIDDGCKFDALEDLIEDLATNGSKCVLWSHWVGGVELAYQRLSKVYKGVYLHGGVPQNERIERVNAFQNDPNVKFFVGNPDCAGLGLNLYAANTEIFIDVSYSWIQYAQAVDRLHRIGQSNPVLIVHQIATYRDGRPTIDQYVYDILRRKVEMSANLLGDNIDDNAFVSIVTNNLLKEL